MSPSPTIHERKPIKGAVVWWLRWFGVLAFIVILLQLPRSQDLPLLRMDVRWLGFCMLLTVFMLLTQALVWQWLLAVQRIRHAYPKTLLAYLASHYLGLVTPGHVGEFLAAGYISMETGITVGYALSSVVMTKVLNWVVLVGCGVWGLQLLATVPLLQGVRWAVVASLVALLALGAGIALWVTSLRHMARRWRRFSPWEIDMTEFRAGLRQLLGPQLVVPLALTAMAFGALFLQLDAVLRALGQARPLPLVSQVVACSRLVGRIVPLSFVGFGSKDAAVIGLLAQDGLDPAVGLAATVLLLVCSYLLTLLISGICWWVKPLVVRRVVGSPGARHR